MTKVTTTGIPRALQALENTDERLDSIEFKEDLRYVWVDEDGKRVSPIHGDFGRALTWFQNWDTYKRRLDLKEARDTQHLEKNSHDWAQSALEALRHDIAKERLRLSLTGKPPVSLQRLVLIAHVEEINDAERQVIGALKTTSR